MCAEGGSNLEVAARLALDRKTVSKWRARFLSLRLEGLHDEARPGAPRTIGDDAVESVIVKTLEETPRDATHWSTRSMAQATGMSQSAISRIWRAFGLKPHLTETFKLSPDPLFVDKVRDIVGLYVNPPEGALVLCVDEKSQIQALDRTAPVLPIRPGLPERRTHDYVRHGTTNLYAALDVASGNIIADMTERHRAAEFRRFLNLINRSVPDDLEVHLVVDNSSTHKNTRDPPVAAAPPALSTPLHPDLQLMVELGRAMVRRAHQQVAAPKHPPLDQGARGRHHRMGGQLERRAKAIRLAQERRRDPGHARCLLRAHLRLTSLARVHQSPRRGWHTLPPSALMTH